jgi:predicted ArsR family transcriptional regulator
MRSPLTQRFARTQKYKILRTLKEHAALSIQDFLQKLDLSYMGIKQHCIELERDGFLVKKRRARASGRGRPEQAYELTPSAEEFFPQHDTLLTRQIISALRQLYGTNAPEKILFTIFQNRIAYYREKTASATLEERLEKFMSLREGDGYFLNLQKEEQKVKIVEYHSPLQGLLAEFPILMNFELQLYQKSIHPEMHRSQFQKKPYRAVYTISKISINEDS